MIVSNLAWGCPRHLWYEEVRRHGLDSLVDGFLCCRDVGRTKPAKEIFMEALRRTGTFTEETIFVGDSVRCDVEGPRKCGITAGRVKTLLGTGDPGNSPSGVAVSACLLNGPEAVVTLR